MTISTSIHKSCQHVDTVSLLKTLGTYSTRVFINRNMAVEGFEYAFPGELSFVSEEDPPWKVGRIHTTELPAEVASWRKIF